jgi:hypothetical protein
MVKVGEDISPIFFVFNEVGWCGYASREMTVTGLRDDRVVP